MESLFKYKSYEIVYAELSEKVTVSKKYLLLKKSFSEKVAVRKYPLHKRTCSEYIYSEEKAPPKQHLCWKSNYLQDVVDQKKKYQEIVICYQEVVERSSCLKGLVSFQCNQCYSENIAASIRNLRHSDWCSEIRWRKWKSKCLQLLFYKIQIIAIAIPDFGVSTAILNPIDIFRRLRKLNFGLLRGHDKSPRITAILLKGQAQGDNIFTFYTYFLK